MKLENIFVSDFETTTATHSTESSEVLLAGLKALGSDKYNIFTNLDDYFDYLLSFKTKRIVYFHNLKFDGEFIIHWLIKHNFVFNKDKKELVENQFTYFRDGRGTIYSMRIETKYSSVEFRDSVLLIPMSLKKIGKEIDLDKLEINYDMNKITDEYIEYFKRDLDILEVAIQFFYNQYKPKLTIASTSQNDIKETIGLREFAFLYGGKVWNKKMKKMEEIEILSKELYGTFKQGYRGGLTIFNPLLRGVVVNDVYGYDVNSLYPSVMEKYELPYGTPSKNPIGHLKLVKIFIKKATKKQPHYPNLLPHPTMRGLRGTNDESYLESAENITLWIPHMEIEWISKFYNLDYDITETWYFRSNRVIGEYVSNNKQLKINAKNKMERTIYKLSANSIYGKFGMNIVSEQKYLELYDPNYHNKNEHRFCTRYGNYIEVKEETEMDRIPYIPIALFTTGLARVELMKAIWSNVDNFIYADTDSIYLTKPAVGIEIDPNDYGKWKFEGLYKRFKYLKAKCYIKEVDGKIIHTIAGVRTAEGITFENFKVGLEIKNAGLSPIKVDGGIILVSVDKFIR